MSADQDTFLLDLVSLAEGLRPVLEEHLRDYGEILPTLLMADVERWAEERAVEDRSGELARVLLKLEASCSGGTSHVRELIGVGFAELVSVREASGQALVRLLGPCLRAEVLQAWPSWRPETE